MRKTELVPLDVPQSLIRQHSVLEASQTNSTASIENRLLTLAYMSSLPFDDVEAGEALASLSTLARNATSDASLASAAAELLSSDKCHGAACELLVVGSLSPSLALPSVSSGASSSLRSYAPSSFELMQRNEQQPQSTNLLKDASLSLSAIDALTKNVTSNETSTRQHLSASDEAGDSLQLELAKTQPATNKSPSRLQLTASNLGLVTIVAILSLVSVQFAIIVFLCRSSKSRR